MPKIISPFTRTLVSVVFVGGLLMANPLHAAQTSSSTMNQNVEDRIKTLHDKLKITSNEEQDWGVVAQTMRDNEATMHQLIEARHEAPESMTAIDDLQSYEKIAQAHVDGLKSLIPNFQTLYNEMTDAQKKLADAAFGNFEGHKHGAQNKNHG